MSESAIRDLEAKAILCRAMGQKSMTFWSPDGWKAPKGFPRRSLVCKPTQGGSTWAVGTLAMCRYLGVGPG